MTKISDYFKGWLVGDFSPCLVNNKDIEIGIKEYKAGDSETSHYHKISTEYTIVLSGSVTMLEKEYGKGDIITIFPNVHNKFISITDSILLVIKTPSVPKDKYIIEESL